MGLASFVMLSGEGVRSAWKPQQPGCTPGRAELMKRTGLEGEVLQKIRESSGRFLRRSKDRKSPERQSTRAVLGGLQYTVKQVYKRDASLGSSEVIQ